MEQLLAKLPGAKKSGNGWSAKCPAHDDHNASLSVSEGDDGRALVKCHAGCSADAVCAAVRLTLRDLMPECAESRLTTDSTRSKGKPKPSGKTFGTANAAVESLEKTLGKHTAWWTYTDAAGNPVGVVVRWDGPNGKDIRPVSRHAEGWCIGAMPDPRPLYRLPELTGASRVLAVEGEKCADVARSLGFIVTTSSGGAQAAVKTDWSPLAGKEVWILPDNDVPGRKYADEMADILGRLMPAGVVKIVELPDLADGGDIADWIAAREGVPADRLRAEIEAIARSAEPVIATGKDETQFRPFPVDALPDPVRQFVAAGAKALACEPSYLALPLLVAAAAAIGNTRRLELKRGWSAPAILWGAIVGESGTTKTPAFGLVMRPVRDRQRESLERHAEAARDYEAELARWEKEMTAWKRNQSTTDAPAPKPQPPAAERFLVSDTTVEALAPILLENPRGVLLARDELAAWVGSFDRYAGKGNASADAANWLSMFNADNVTVDRKTGVPKTLFVPRASVSVVGGIQPGILRRVFGAEHRESGLAARLLVAFPPRRRKRWTEADIDPKTEEKLAELFDQLYELKPTEDENGRPRAVLVRLTPEAKAAWIAYYDAHAEEQAELTGDLAAAWSKLEEYAARLALVVHFIRWAANDPKLADPGALDLDSMTRGIELARWFKHEARRVYAMLDESDAERDQRRLAEWVENRGGRVTARAVQQGCRWLMEPGAAEAALEELVKAGRGSWRPPETTGKGGRPSRVFVLSTPSNVYETSTFDAAGEGLVDVDVVEAEYEGPDIGSTDFPFGFNNPDDPDGERLFSNPTTQLPD
jgi:hypothetical protein